MSKMNDSDKNNRKRIKTAAVLYLILLAIAASTAFGWFIFNREVSVSSASGEDSIQIAVNGGDLEIFLVDSETTEEDLANDALWGSERTYTPEKQGYYIDISGDGSRLWYPRTLDQSDQPILNNGSVEDITDSDAHYVTLKLLFRTTTAMDVYLASDSCVSPLEYVTGDHSYGRKSINSSDAEPFSCDGIVGAARVAFLEGVKENGGEKKELKMLWIPNDKLELRKPAGAGGTYSLVKGGRSELEARGYSYLKMNAEGSLEQYTITPEEYASGKVAVTPGWPESVVRSDGRIETTNYSTGILANTSTNRSNQAAPLLSFTETGKMQIKTLYVRLWFEGTDREADSAFSGGMASYRFCFAGISKKDPQPVNLYYNSEKKSLCTGSPEDADYNTPEAAIAENIEYSMDGVSWSAYNPDPDGHHPNITPGRTVFVRTKETDAEKPGKAIRLIITE